ncbi:MAG: hydantoinase B/oxoprolinase family protein [Haloarculaceae archaeon]
MATEHLDDRKVDTSDGHTGSNVWQDFVSGYIPEDPLDVHPSLSLHTRYDSDLDPVTYEVLRHRLYTINEEHGATLENVSGSPVAYFAQDFNPTILTATGEVVFQGPYIQFFSPIAELQAKWVLENRSDNPGIEPGDVFLSNDTWVGSTHQPDVFFLAPVFHEGELFCWVVNTLHQYDIGGKNAGSFCPGAESVFEEPTPIPPIKIVEGGEVREDLRQMYLRHSRLPQMVGLDFNAQLAGVNVARDRVKETIEEYSAETVKGVMHDVLDDAEEKFLQKLEKIPDGTYRGRAYMDGSKTGDTGVYRGEVQIIKEGDTLTFRNENTHENKDAINCTYAGFRTAIMSVLNPFMMQDAMWVSGGPLRHIEIDTTPGTMSHANWPNGTSNGGTVAVPFVIQLVNNAVNRMLAASEDLKESIISGQNAGGGAVAQAGIDQWGEEFGTMNLDCMSGGIGAAPHRDGVDTGGQYWAPKAPIPNMEHNEQDYPILYLYRSEVPDTGGPGEQRGGAGMDYCWKPHRTSQIDNVYAASGVLAPLSKGISGYPGGNARFDVMNDSDAEERFERREIPQNIEEFEGDLDKLHSKAHDLQQPDDVAVIRNGGTPGYGDPIKRDPEKVAADVERGVVTEEAAREIYGVAIEWDGDEAVARQDATEERREVIREQRLDESTIPGGD